MKNANDLSQPASLQNGLDAIAPGSRLRWQAAFAEVLRALRSDRRVWAVLAAVLLMDAVLLLLDVGFRLTRDHYSVPMGAYSIASDGGFGERGEYLLSALGAAASFLLAWRHRSLAAATVGAVFCLALADNAFQFHEQIGLLGQGLMPQDWPLAGNSLVQLIVMSIFGALSLALLAVALLRRATALNAGLAMVVGLICIAAGFGVFVDALHSGLRGGTRLFTAVTLLEDGGELIFMTLAGGTAASLAMISQQLEQRTSAMGEGAGDR